MEDERLMTVQDYDDYLSLALSSAEDPSVAKALEEASEETEAEETSENEAPAEETPEPAAEKSGEEVNEQ